MTKSPQKWIKINDEVTQGSHDAFSHMTLISHVLFMLDINDKHGSKNR